jgi:hypothetical protein
VANKLKIKYVSVSLTSREKYEQGRKQLNNSNDCHGTDPGIHIRILDNFYISLAGPKTMTGEYRK